MADDATFSDNEINSAFSQADAQQRQTAAANLAAARGVTPKAATSAIKVAPKTGIPASVGMTDPSQGNTIAQTQDNSDLLDGDPRLQSWVAKSPAHAAASQENLSGVAGVIKQVHDYYTAPWDSLWQSAKALADAQRRQVQGQETTAEKIENLPIAASGLTGAKAIYDWAGLAAQGVFTALNPTQAAAEEQTNQATQRFYTQQLGPKWGPEAYKLTGALANLALFFIPGPKGEAGGFTPEEPIAGQAPPEPPPSGGAPRAESEVPPPKPEPQWHKNPDGTPMEFNSLREAAVYARDNPLAGTDKLEPVSMGGQATRRSMEEMNASGEGTGKGPSEKFRLKVVLGEPYVDVPPPGMSPETDAVHADVADIRANAVRATEEKIQDLPFNEQVPELTEELLNDQGVDRHNAYIPAKGLMELVQNGTIPLEDLTKLAGDRTGLAAFTNAHETGSDFAVTLSHYLATVAGKPYADALREITRFSGDGVSQAEGKDMHVSPGDTSASMTGENPMAGTKEKLAAKIAASQGFNIKDLPDYVQDMSKVVDKLSAEMGTQGLKQNPIPYGQIPMEAKFGSDTMDPVDRRALREKVFEAESNKTTELVPLSKIKSPQTSIVMDKAYEATPKPEKEVGEAVHGTLEKYKGEYYVVSGNHRIVQAMSQGETHGKFHVIDLEKALETGHVDEEVQPFKVEHDPEMSDQENEALATQIPALQIVAKQVAAEVYLKGIYGDGAALGMTERELKQWSVKVQKAQQAVYEKLIRLAKERIKRYRTAQWKATYMSHYGDTYASYMSRPGIKAWHQLTEAQAEATDLKTGNALVDIKGNPVTFYRVTNYHDTGDGEVPLDLFANPRSPQSPHPYWKQTIAKSTYRGASFAEDPKFTSQWASHQYLAEETDYNGHIIGYEKRPVTFVSYVKVAPDKLADFRNPKDVDKAMDWYVSKNPQLPGESDGEFRSRTNMQRRAYEQGFWSQWENKDLIHAMGWDAVRMVEREGMRKKPNLFVANPEAIHWKYDRSGVPTTIRLSSADKANYSPELIKSLPKGIWDDQGGAVDDFAEQLGYNSGEALLHDLAEIQANKAGAPFKTWLERQIKAETEQRAQDELGWDLSKESLLQMAQEMIDTPQVEDLLTDSMSYLARRFGLAFDKSMVENAALESFAQTSVKDALDIKLQQKNLWNNMREVEKGLLSEKPEDIITAFKARQDALQNYYKLQAAMKFQKTWAAYQRKVKGWASAELGKTVDPDFVDQIHGLLAQSGIRVAHDMLALQQAMTETPYSVFRDFWNNHGFDLEEDPVPRNEYGFPTGNLQKASTRDFEDMYSALQKMSHIGANIKAGTMLSEKASLNALVAEANANLMKRPPTITVGERNRPTRKQMATHLLRDLDAWLLRMEQMFIDLDYRDPDGPFNRAVVLPLEARKGWHDDAQRHIAEHFHDLRGRLEKGFAKWSKTRIDTSDYPELVDKNGDPYFITKGDIVGAALHTGNDNNWNALMRSWPEPVPKSVFNRLFNEHMTKDAWTYVQGMWDIFKEFKPELYEMYRRRNGVPLPTIPDVPFTNQHGEFSGGYYPITRSSLQLPKNYVNPDKFMDNENYWRPMPANPHAKTRTGSTAPMDFKLEHGRLRLNQLVHDVAYRDVLSQIDRFINNDSLKNTILRKYGPEYFVKMQDLIRKTAGGQDFDTGQSELYLNLIEGANRRAVVDLIGYSTQTVLKHGTTALSHTIATVGSKQTLAAYHQMFTHWGDFWDFVLTHSPEVRNRVMNVSENARATYLKLIEKDGVVNWIQQHAFDAVAASDQFSAAAAWWAAYHDAVVTYPGENAHDRAVALADQAVRQAHGSSGMIDSAPFLKLGKDRTIPGAVYRGSIALMNFFSHTWNRSREIPQDLFGAGGQTRNIPRGLKNMVLIVGVAAAIEKEFGEWFGQQVQSAWDAMWHIALTGIPGVNDVLADMEGKESHESSMYSEAPIAIGKAGVDLKRGLAGKEVKYPLEDAANVAGLTLGLPGNQVGKSTQFLSDWATGRERNVHNPGDFIHGLLAGPQGLIPPDERGKPAAGSSRTGRRGNSRGARGR